MKIYFESHPYFEHELKEHIPEKFCTITTENNCVKWETNYVGYYYNCNDTEPDKSDSVFVLPKVFLDKNDHPFGLTQIKPKDIIDITDENSTELRNTGMDSVIYELSIWIYRAINHYIERNQDTTITEKSNIQNVVSNRGENSTTCLDIILELIKFHKEHQSLFTYISIVNSSGNNKIHWSKTVAKVQPIISDDIPAYISFRNKNKVINFDEELIILFYSVLQYANRKYKFKIKTNIQYELLRPSEIEKLIVSGKGTRRLKQIRHNYFTDELVQLWNLLYIFFGRFEDIANRHYHEETLLVKDFDQVFEDMIDQLIGGEDEIKDYERFKVLKDNKKLDHIYPDKSLIFAEPNQIYFIGDSKYYKSGDNPDKGTSLEKQFTYARNIIRQLIAETIPFERRGVRHHGFFYRDAYTDGYNLTPNFFVRGYVDNVNQNYNYDYPELIPRGSHCDKYYDDRLFDRDTLWAQLFDINFLYVLASYVNGSDDKNNIRSKFRKQIMKMYDNNYHFYKIYPNGDWDLFLRSMKVYLEGRLFSPQKVENADYMIVAFENGSEDELGLINTLEEMGHQPARVSLVQLG